MTVSVSIKLPTTDSRVVAEEFDNFRQRMLGRSQEILEDTIHQELVNRNLVVEGDLSESWEFDLSVSGDTSVLTASSDDIAGSVLEYGANPADSGVVNIDEILNWLLKKGAQSEFGTIEEYAWAIAKKIGRLGQPLHGGLKRPFNAAQKKSKRLIEREWERGIAELVRSLNG